jgi:mono/diheme cytochrome c family protein
MKIRTRIYFMLCAALLLIITGCKVSAPGSMETKMVQTMKHDVTIGGKDDKNPTPDTPDTVKEGMEHFGHHCQICHGLDGQNTGVPFATKMSPPVADLKSKDVQDYTDGQLKWIIENGIEPSGMPGWKGILSDEEMWNVVRYIRHLPAKGSLGAPAIFKEESEEHEKMEHMDHGAMKNEAKPPEHKH